MNAAKNASNGTACAARNAGCATSGGDFIASVPRFSLIGKMSCGIWFSGAGFLSAARAGIGEAPALFTLSGTAGCVSVWYWPSSGLKNANDRGGSFMHVRIQGRNNLLKSFGSLKTKLVAGFQFGRGADRFLKSRHASCGGSVTESSAPRPETWRRTVMGSPTVTLVGPAVAVIVKSPRHR